jgi:ADP-ribose pyrophosphatase YjhB (NUDIX family)
MSDRNTEFTLTAAEAAALRQGFRYCPRCRAEMVDREVYGRVRRVCSDDSCRFVQFLDPKVSAAMMAIRDDGKVLLIRRNMEPAKGSWCFPGGFMEMGEHPQATAQRECLEESGFEVEILKLVDVYYYEDYRGSGVLIMYKGKIIGGQAQPGDDAETVDFFGPEELPENIVFDSNRRALALWREGKV